MTRTIRNIFFTLSLIPSITQANTFTLQELFDIADKQSRTIKLSDLKVQETEQQTKVTQNAWLPSIKLSASACYLENNYALT